MHGHPRRGRCWWQRVGLSIGLIMSVWCSHAFAIFLDKEETLRFNGRVYNRVRTPHRTRRTIHVCGLPIIV